MLLKESGGYEAHDLSVIYHEGIYYHCLTVNAEALYITRAQTLEKLIDADPICVFTPMISTPNMRGRNMKICDIKDSRTIGAAATEFLGQML